MSSTSFVFDTPPINGATASFGGSSSAIPTAVPVTQPTSGATSIDWGNLLNKGFDLGAQLAAASLSKPKNNTVVYTTDMAAANAAAAGSRAGAAGAQSTPAWLWPVVAVVGGLSLLGIIVAALRK